MLNFLKKLFAKEEIQEEKIGLNELNSWLDEKSKAKFESFDLGINETLEKINHEKEKVKENLKILEDAKLQNPKIPDRVKTIMEGNRAGFIKKVSYFFNNMDLKYNNPYELIQRCKNIGNEIEQLGKGTARSYQVLGEFFARQAENVAINIKNVENYSKGMINAINDSKIRDIDKIKISIIDIQNKTKLKQRFSVELEDNTKDLQDNKNKKSEIENNINKIKSSSDYGNYEKLLEEKEKIKAKLNEIESGLFHDFSVLEKGLKKYAKIAFENEKLILEYLNSTIITLIKDDEFKILKILDSLKNAIANDEFGLDEKKKGKILAKIDELDGVYFTKVKDDFAIAKKRLNEIKSDIESDNSKKDLHSLNLESIDINQNIENINNKIISLNDELEKINIERLKENLQDEINDVTNVRIILI